MLSDFPAGFSAHSRYSLFKAADGKIALSVVHVNNKPQHIVFCLHSPHLFSKQRRLLVESANGLGECGVPKAALPPNRCNPGTRGKYPLLHKASPSGDRGQGAEMVQIWSHSVRNVEIRGRSWEAWMEKPRFPSLPKQRLRRNHLLVQYPYDSDSARLGSIEHHMSPHLKPA